MTAAEKIERIKAKAAQWENRVVELTFEDPASLIPNEMNFRRHPSNQRQLFRSTVNEVGFLDAIKVNKRTGRILDGHLRTDEAIAAGIEKIAVLWLDIPEEDEDVALAMFDAISAMAAEDAAMKAELLAGIDHVADQELASYLARELERQRAEADSHAGIDELASKYGAYDPDESLPVIKIKVSEETKRRWESYFGGLAGHDDAKLTGIMDRLGVPALEEESDGE